MESNKPDQRATNRSNQLVSPALTPVLEHPHHPKTKSHGYFSMTHHGRDQGPDLEPWVRPGHAIQVLRHDLTLEFDEADKERTSNSGHNLEMGLRGEKPQPDNEAVSMDSTDIKVASRHDVLKISSAQLEDLTSPESLPVRVVPPASSSAETGPKSNGSVFQDSGMRTIASSSESEESRRSLKKAAELDVNVGLFQPVPLRPTMSSRALTAPQTAQRRPSVAGRERSYRYSSSHATQETTGTGVKEHGNTPAELKFPLEPDPMSPNLPLPPYSIPTYLQLELSVDRPSPLYIQRTNSGDYPYEASKVKFERLMNFILLPPHLERLLWFGALTCLDAWLYTFTILPLRFLHAAGILLAWGLEIVWNNVNDIFKLTYTGIGRRWAIRLHGLSIFSTFEDQDSSAPSAQVPVSALRTPPRTTTTADSKSRPRAKSARASSARQFKTLLRPSLLQVNHKADLLQGLLIIVTCIILTRFDASRMYHSIRGQAAIKLYVIYNVLEVSDRLLSAIGQDILECLFSSETLERKSNGRSKIVRPLSLFFVALIYSVIHSTALFYQVITLNVAVNSYSNALLTLLISNQFVEIKGSVFKKFEKENLFQLTCADVVERFQLWLMLLIIALRNIVEVGGLSINLGPSFTGPMSSGSTPPVNISSGNIFNILPNSFTIMPSLLPFQVLGPFLLVLGSETMVDWIKHAYIIKFNATSPGIYSRFFDVLAKDYYSNAFAEQNLTRRLGLPVIPLSCLFIRAALQTYHMFLSTSMPSPIISASTSLSIDSNPATASPALARIDQIFRRALGRSSFGGGGSSSSAFWIDWSIDDAIALSTMLVFFLVLYLLLLAFKLLLGMALLGISRDRYRGMKQREQQRVVDSDARRVGGWGVVEVGEERRRWIYDGHEEELRKLRERENRPAVMRNLESIRRYSMVAKRIW